MPRTCVMRDCDRPVNANNFCVMHYKRWRRYGDPDGSSGLMSVAHRFWSKVDKTDDCWIWTGGTSTDGRGNTRRPMMNVGGRAGSMRLAIHVAWFLEYGRWPEIQMNHHCDNELCVRVHHLYDGTQAKNMGDYANRGRGGKCMRGHPWTPQSTQVRANGTRYCKTCQNEKRREKRQAQGGQP